MNFIPEKGDKGLYTSLEASKRIGVNCRWFRFECIGHYKGKVIIITNKGHVHLKDPEEYVFRGCSQ